MHEQVKEFLKTVETIRFHDGSCVEGYENDARLVRFRGVREDGYTQIGFETVSDALAWTWELTQEAK